MKPKNKTATVNLQSRFNHAALKESIYESIYFTLTNSACTAFAVCQIRRDDELGFAANLHQRDAFVPAFDDVP